MREKLKDLLKLFISDLKINFKEMFNKKTFYRQIPNILTSIRAIISIPFNILFFKGQYKLAVFVLAIAFFTDAIDGKIARKFNLVSKFGADLDAVCDKLMVIGVIIPVCFTQPLLITNLVLEIIISIINLYAKLYNLNPKSSPIGKLKTWPLSITIILAYFNIFYKLPQIIITSIIIITIGLQMFTMIDYLAKMITDYIKSIGNKKRT